MIQIDHQIWCEETVFDPEKARDAGVPEGPKFGALARGEQISIDGDTIQPDDVMTDRRRVFPLE